MLLLCVVYSFESNPSTPCMLYLPAKLGDFVRANVGVHIPAPWFADGKYMASFMIFHL